MNPLTGIFGAQGAINNVVRTLGQRGSRSRRLKSLEDRVAALEGGDESQAVGAVQQNAQEAQSMPAGVGQMGGMLQSNEAGGTIGSVEPDEEKTAVSDAAILAGRNLFGIRTRSAAQDMFGTGFMRDQALSAAKLIENKTLSK